MKIKNEMITTAFDIPGYTIVKNLGIVRGISVRSPGWLGGMLAGFQSLKSGNVRRLTQLCEETRHDALELLINEAHALGANAIIGFRYDTNEVLANVTEVFAYGTAVIVKEF